MSSREQGRDSGGGTLEVMLLQMMPLLFIPLTWRSFFFFHSFWGNICLCARVCVRVCEHVCVCILMCVTTRCSVLLTEDWCHGWNSDKRSMHTEVCVCVCSKCLFIVVFCVSSGAAVYEATHARTNCTCNTSFFFASGGLIFFNDY